MPPDCTKSEFELFKSLSNPRKTNFAKTSVVSAAIENELRNSPPPREEEHERPEFFPSPQPSSRPPPSESSRGSHHHQETTPPPPPEEDDGFDDVAEKQALLVELNDIRSRGVVLSRNFTMDDRLGDMRFEVNRIRSNWAASDAADMATGYMQMAMYGIEKANNKWGPVLHLDGWARSVDSNKESYRSVFTQLYKKYVRKGGATSPELSLALLLGGGAFGTHLGHTMKDGEMQNVANLMPNLMSSTKPPPPPPQEPPSRGGAFTNRPTMRGPTPIPKPQVPPAPPAPPPSSTHQTMYEMKIEALEKEKAALQAQLHQRVNSRTASIFMTHVKPTHHNSAAPLPDIEILN